MNPREFWARLTTWIRRPALERNLAAELDAHLELSARELEAEGLSTVAATTEARRRFGSLARAREASRDAWGFPALDGLARDVRQAVRGLVRSPVYSATIVLMLALGIGANTAVFSFLNGLFLTTAPVSSPQTLYSIFSSGGTSAELRATSFQNYEDLQRALRFDIAAHVSIPVALVDDTREAEQVPAALVSSNYFRVLGVRAQSGRTFRESPTLCSPDTVQSSSFTAVSGTAIHGVAWRTRRRVASHSGMPNSPPTLHATSASTDNSGYSGGGVSSSGNASCDTLNNS